jgi:hypothetical protein
MSAQIMNIANSTAIESVSFGDNSAVGVRFKGNDSEYGFLAKDQNAVRSALETAIGKGDSIGKLIATLRSEGQLQAV